MKEVQHGHGRSETSAASKRQCRSDIHIFQHRKGCSEASDTENREG
jgi:hypothetical protein